MARFTILLSSGAELNVGSDRARPRRGLSVIYFQ
jgi:hypothetical protein